MYGQGQRMMGGRRKPFRWKKMLLTKQDLHNFFPEKGIFKNEKKEKVAVFDKEMSFFDLSFINTTLIKSSLFYYSYAIQYHTKVPVLCTLLC